MSTGPSKWETRIKKAMIALALLTVFAAPVSAADNIETAMLELQARAAKLGPPVLKGQETIADRTVPVLYFGDTKANGNTALVDDVQKATGAQTSIFVRSGPDFVRVATTIKDKAGARIAGSVLDPKGKAYAALAK